MRPLVLILLAASASAQPGWRPAPGGETVSVDLFKPFGSVSTVVVNHNGGEVGEVRTGSLTSALALSVRVPVGAGVALDAQVPVAYIDYGSTRINVGSSFAYESDLALGHPYLGAAWTVRRGAPEVAVEVGGRIPVYDRDPETNPTSEDDPDLAWYRAAPDQREAFIPSLASGRAAVRVRQPVGAGVTIDARLAGIYGVSTREVVVVRAPPGEESLTTRPEYRNAVLSVLATGRAGRIEWAAGAVSDVLSDVGDRGGYPSKASVVATVALDGRVRPTVSARLPLTDYDAFTVGLGVGVRL